MPILIILLIFDESQGGKFMGRIAKWKTFSEEEVRKIVAESYSIREVARKMGYEPNGGSTASSLKKMIEEYQIDTSHFTGQGWNKGNYDYSKFDLGTYKKRGQSTIKPLVQLRGRKCECCGNTEWLGNPINLEIHHINGDRTDNRLENLQLLCPNCHSYTENYCRKKRRPISDEEFVNALRGSKNISQALNFLNLRGGDNYKRAWKLIDEYNIEHLKN